MAKPQQDEFDTANVMGSYSVGEWAEAPENPANQAAAVEAAPEATAEPASDQSELDEFRAWKAQQKAAGEPVKVSYPDPPGSQE